MNSNLSYSRETVHSRQIWRFFVPCDLEIWRMTLKNNRAPLRCCIKLGALFQIHQWIQAGVKGRKHPIWAKIDDFFSHVTVKFDGWRWQTALRIISPSYVNSNWSYGPEMAKLGFDLRDIDLWPMALTFCMDITFVIGNNSWKFHDDTITGTLWKRCDRQTDRQTDGRTDRWTEVFLDVLGRS